MIMCEEQSRSYHEKAYYENQLKVGGGGGEGASSKVYIGAMTTINADMHFLYAIFHSRYRS